MEKNIHKPSNASHQKCNKPTSYCDTNTTYSGIALLIWTTGRWRLGGVVLVFMVSFIGYMLMKSYNNAKYGTAHFETGTTISKFTKQFSTTNSQGFSHSDTAYYIEVDISAAYTLTSDGQGDPLSDKTGVQKFIVDKSIYDQIKEHETINAVFMPNASGIHSVILANGSIVK